MTIGLRLLAAVLWLPLAACASAGAVRVEGGLVRSQEADGVRSWKAVPFAAPPVGPLRWREPQPVVGWRGVLANDAFAPACMQTGVSMPGETPPAASEDCLYLNIWAPAGPLRQALPVLVWIHGGGFANGSASMPLYWGDRLARRDVIVVTVAYRLGPFGFLAHPELSAESPNRVSGNYGLLDQIAALRWVQRNIAVFGGDPGRVTVAGQSAGATSVSLLMASPLAKGLFQRAIGQSGGAFEPIALAPGWRLSNAEQDGAAYARSVGAASLAELRKMPADQLLKGRANSISHPVQEPHALPQTPYDVFLAGGHADVPLLVGSNADEARSIIDLSRVTAANFHAELQKAWGPLPPPLIAAYPFVTDTEARQARCDFERDLRFGWDIRAWARLQAEHGRSRVYAYHFTRAPPFLAGSPQAGWGASHFAELWYMSDHLDQEAWPWTPADRQLAEAMATYWTNFVKTGDPNGPGVPPWPAFTAAGGETLYLGDPISSGGPANPKTLNVFDAVYASLRATR